MNPFMLSVTITALLALAVPSGGAPGPLKPPLPEFPTGGFAAMVDNPYFPLRPGTVLVYETRAGRTTEMDTVEVMRDTRVVRGVPAVVVRDRTYRDGKLVEESFDWYAQDRQGNVWSLGEDTKDLVDSLVVDTTGSWEAGRDSARAGIVMPGVPEVGTEYRRAYRRGRVEDLAVVVHLDAKVTVLDQTFTPCVETEEWSELGGEARERKVYAPGLGLVSRRTVTGAGEWTRLVKLIVR